MNEFSFGGIPTSLPMNFLGDSGCGGLREGSAPWTIGGESGSHIHWSPNYGVHADLGEAPTKQHIPFIGQTTLPTFGIGGSPSAENDANLGNLGGTFQGW